MFMLNSFQIPPGGDALSDLDVPEHGDLLRRPDGREKRSLLS
jgi:hypothetical protein